MTIDEKAERVRESMVKQLNAKGAGVAHFTALIDDYISYFKLAEKMKISLAEDGLILSAVSVSGKEYDKENPAAKLLPTYTKTMLSILREMGLTTDEPTEEAIEDDL